MASTPLKARSAAPAKASRQGFMGQWGMFFRQFVKHPGMVGSIIPSSRALVDAMLDPVDWDRARLFVEYGPGVGTFTRPILERMHPDATLLAIDLNHDFVDYLASSIPDPRLRVVHGSAADVGRFVAEAGHVSADYVLSGLPFSTLPAGVGENICRQTRAVLRPEGAFLVYQFSAHVAALLNAHFDRVAVRTEWRNIPPCRLFQATKVENIVRAA